MKTPEIDENFKIGDVSILNNLDVGVIIFYGTNIQELVPVYCNEKFFELSGFTVDDFKIRVVKTFFYCVHPDDIEIARQKFLEAFINKKSINHIIRVRRDESEEYKYVAMTGTIKHEQNNSFYVYLTFSDAQEAVHSQNILAERYKNLISKSKNFQPNLLSLLHFNLTKDKCDNIFRKSQFSYKAVTAKKIDDFILTAIQNIPEQKYKDDFKKSFSRDALISSFNKGFLNVQISIPILMSDEQITWCNQKASLARNPQTKDIECILTLIEHDADIRLENSFKVILKNDYEFVANMNVHTGLVRVITSEIDHGLPFFSSSFFHQDVLPKRLSNIVQDEFVEMATKALSLETIVSELKNKDVYVCTFPAKTSVLGHEGAFQWRLGYIDESKEEIVFTRTEVLGFLDIHQQVQKNVSALQKQALETGQKAKQGFAERNKILIADDSDINREMLAIIFEDNFDVIHAEDGDQAIHLIDQNYKTIALILLDMQMPKKTGLDVLLHLKMRNLQDSIPTILVTSSTSKELGLRSLEYGISDIINKPFDSKIVKRRASNLIELYAHKEEVENQLEKWKNDAITLHKQAEKNNELLIDVLSSVVEFRSIESGTHIKRVRKLTEIMLKTWVLIEPDVELTDADIEQIARASTLHDIGKVAIPDNILLKPGKLTSEEFDVMKSHTMLGCKFLEQIKQDNNDFYKYCYDICRYHHERADGRGYPDGLKDDKIPFWAQIVSIADVYDALISPRVYKAAYSSEKAIEMIRNGECGNFSQRLLNCFESAKNEIVSESKKMAEVAS